MDDETEVIKQQMAHTRESLHAKVEALEHRVVDTVQDATNTVASTVESVSDTVASVKDTVQGTVESVKDTLQGTMQSVKGSVQDTVESVRDALDIRRHVEERPWTVVAGSIAVGFIGGLLLTPRRRDPRDGRWPDMTERSFLPASLPSVGHGNGLPPPQAGAQSMAAPQQADEKPGWFDKVAEQARPALDRLKELAIGYTTNLMGEMLLHNAPSTLRTDLAGVIDQFTTALGGKPMPHEPPPARPSAAQSMPAPRTQSAPEGDHQQRPHNRLTGTKGRGNGRSAP